MSTGSRGRGDAESSRTALLGAARELFATRGFDRTTVRAIAERAEVNQALLFRYFGSKDALFAAALGDEVRELVGRWAPDELLAATLRRMFDADHAENPLYAALRSPGHETALAALRTELGEPYRRAFASLAAGNADSAHDADLRADLLLAWLLGIGFARSVLAVRSLAEADPAAVVEHVRRGADALLGTPE